MASEVEKKIESYFSQFPRRNFAAKNILIHAGVRPKFIYYIESGLVRQYDITTSGSEIVVNVFKPGSFLPLLPLITKTKNLYLYEAFSKLSARVAPAKETLSFVRNDSAILFHTLEKVLRGAEGMQRRMAYLMGSRADKRVLFELILECQRFGIQQPDGSYTVDIHEQELAQRSGLTRETVSRELRKLNAEAAVVAAKKQIIIKDVAKLHALLGEEL